MREQEKAIQEMIDGSYKGFVEKFEPKKTTDDCYTPENIYDVVADFVAIRYGLNRENFRRVFWPGGDYQAETYCPEDVVVDNPPFSILSQIVTWYQDRGRKSSGRRSSGRKSSGRKSSGRTMATVSQREEHRGEIERKTGDLHRDGDRRTNDHF